MSILDIRPTNEYWKMKKRLRKLKEEKVSNCCGAIENELQVCLACKEHCEFIDTE